MTLKEEFIKLGYTEEDYEIIRNNYAVNQIKDETLIKKLKDNFAFLLKMGYTKEEVRENLVALQRNMAKGKNVIMEGRDITTVVFPNADFKFYLDASLDERVKRRLEQNKEKGIDMSESEIRDNIAKRDYNDMHKKVGALKKTDDQIYIDTSNMTIDEVVNKIVNIVKEGN